MAELLVKAVDAVHRDPIKDRACYKRGDIVDVRPDGHPWGREEGPPKFTIVKMPGVPAKDLAYLIQPQMESMALEGDGAMVLRREWRMNLDDEDLPKKIRDKTDAKEPVSVTKSELKNFVENKNTKEKLK
jgi:hypothetical protein